MSPIGQRCARPSLRRVASGALRTVALLSAGAITLAGAQQNLGFETVETPLGPPRGWTVGPPDTDTVIASDDRTVAQGERSLRIERATATGVTRVTQRVAASGLLGSDRASGAMRVRVSGYVRAADGAAAFPTLWLRIDGPRGPLYLDSYGDSNASTEEAETGVTGDAEPNGGWRRHEVELPLPADVDEVAFGVSVRGKGAAWFDELVVTTVATDSLAPPSPEAVRYLDAALAIMREHSLHGATVDWPTLRKAALAHARGAVSAAEAHLAVRFALRELGDRHSYLQSPRVSRALREAPVANARTGQPLTAPWGRQLDGGVGYVVVPAFAGGTPAHQLEFAEGLKKVIQAHDSPGSCGWVVDLRQNTGGNLWPMLAGLGPLLGEGDLAASVYPDGRRVWVWYRDGKAGFGDYVQLRVPAPYRVQADVPVAVLTGPATASSAEVLAVAFRGRPATRSFGAPTRGVSAGNRTFALADGASLQLTVAATSDRVGRIFDGPVSPDQRVERTRGSGESDTVADAPLEAALTWLAAGDACR